MRDAYIPFFKDLLTSGVWFEDPPIRCVWIALCLNADHEGFVRMNLRGLQREANVSTDDVKRALALFEAPDPDSRDQTLEGRRVVAVERGWHLVTIEAHRRRARLAAEAARKARWDRDHRRAPSEPDADEPSGVGTRRSSDAQKQKPKHKRTPEGESAPPPVDGHTRENCPCGLGRDPFHPPSWCGYHVQIATALADDGLKPLRAADAHEQAHADLVRRQYGGAEGQSIPATYHTLDGWELSPELRADALMAGVPDIEERVAQARTLRIAAPHGTTNRDKWVRAQFPRWRRWREQDAAKQSYGRAPAEPPKPKPPRVKGCPPWVTEEHGTTASGAGLDVRAEAMAFAKANQISARNTRNDTGESFAIHLEQRIRGGSESDARRRLLDRIQKGAA